MQRKIRIIRIKSFIALSPPFLLYLWRSVKWQIQQSFYDLLWQFWQIHRIFCLPLLLPILLFFGGGGRSRLKALQACDEKIQMLSLKPSEGKKHSQRKEFSILRPYPLLFHSQSTPEACVIVCVCVCMDGWVHVRPGLFKRPPCMSAVLASVGVLIKGLSSLCLPWSSPLTRSLGHQRGAAHRGWRRAIAAQTRAGDTRLEVGDWWQTDRREGRLGVGVQFADLLSARDTSCFPDKLFLCSVEWTTLMVSDLQDLLPALSVNMNFVTRNWRRLCVFMQVLKTISVRRKCSL